MGQYYIQYVLTPVATRNGKAAVSFHCPLLTKVIKLLPETEKHHLQRIGEGKSAVPGAANDDIRVYGRANARHCYGEPALFHRESRRCEIVCTLSGKFNAYNYYG